MRQLLLVGYNDGVLSSLDDTADVEVTVLEERDLWDAKSMAAKAAGHRCLTDVAFGQYQQNTQYLEAVRELAAGRRFDAVAPGKEYAVPAAARAADLLLLPGASPRAADTLCDKLELRAVTSLAGMPSPRFREIFNAADIADFAGGRACVVKPSGRQASLGVVLLDAGDDVQEAWRNTTEADEGDHIVNRPMTWRFLVEDRLHGPEYSTECLVRAGQVVFCNVTKKATTAGRRPVELGHVVPASTDVEAAWWTSAQQLTQAVGFGHGLLHAEWVVVDGTPYLIECAGRPPGDRIVDLIDRAYGTNLIAAWVKLLADRPVEIPQRPDRAAAIRFIVGSPGTITAISGVDRARTRPGVENVDVARQVGDHLGDLESSWDRCGSVLAVGNSPDDARRLADEAVADITIHVDRPG